MGRKKKNPDVKDAWCWYCNREFSGEKILVKHQKTKHFKCPTCHKKLYTAPGLSIHCLQVHGDYIDKVPNALSSRNNVEIDIYGMEGISEEDLKEHETMKQAKSIMTKKNVAKESEKQKSPSPQMPHFQPIQQVHQPQDDIIRQEHIRPMLNTGNHMMGPAIGQMGPIMGQVTSVGQMNPMVGSIGHMGPVTSYVGGGNFIGSHQNHIGGPLPAHNTQVTHSHASLPSTSLSHDKVNYPSPTQPTTCTLSFPSFNQIGSQNISDISTCRPNQALHNIPDRNDARKYNLMDLSSIFSSSKMCPSEDPSLDERSGKFCRYNISTSDPGMNFLQPSLAHMAGGIRSPAHPNEILDSTSNAAMSSSQMLGGMSTSGLMPMMPMPQVFSNPMMGGAIPMQMGSIAHHMPPTAHTGSPMNLGPMRYT